MPHFKLNNNIFLSKVNQGLSNELAVYCGYMNLQTYIATFISFLNGIVIPFMLGMAFLVFVINVFRFFILGGANPDSQEKAKQLAVYGVGAFVFIIIFWGVVGLLTSSFGLAGLANNDNTCFDYDILCNDGNSFDQGPRTRPSIVGPAGNPTSRGPTTRASTIPDPQDPGPTTRAIVANGSDLLGTGGPRTRPSIIGTAGTPQDPGPTTRAVIENTSGRVTENIENFASTFTPTEYGSRLNTVVQESITALADSNVSTDNRAQAAVLLETNGYIDEQELASYVSGLNNQRNQLGQSDLDMTAARSRAQQLPDSLIEEIQETQSALLTTLAESNRRWYDVLGEPDQNAQQDALAQVEELYSYPADPDRIAAFDILFTGNEDINQDELTIARGRMIEEINTERFYAGFGPISN
jgi:hypothetical protein